MDEFDFVKEKIALRLTERLQKEGQEASQLLEQLQEQKRKADQLEKQAPSTALKTPKPYVSKRRRTETRTETTTEKRSAQTRERVGLQ